MCVCCSSFGSVFFPFWNCFGSIHCSSRYIFFVHSSPCECIRKFSRLFLQLKLMPINSVVVIFHRCLHTLTRKGNESCERVKLVRKHIYTRQRRLKRLLRHDDHMSDTALCVHHRIIRYRRIEAFDVYMRMRCVYWRLWYRGIQSMPIRQFILAKIIPILK